MLEISAGARIWLSELDASGRTRSDNESSVPGATPDNGRSVPGAGRGSGSQPVTICFAASQKECPEGSATDLPPTRSPDCPPASVPPRLPGATRRSSVMRALASQDRAMAANASFSIARTGRSLTPTVTRWVAASPPGSVAVTMTVASP